MVSAVSGSTAALQGQIERDQLDLNDWVTCVSAKTPKGQAEIQKISGEISSTKERLARIQASDASAPATAAATSPSASGVLEVPGHGGRLDVWA